MALAHQSIVKFITVIAVSLVRLCSGLHRCYQDESEALFLFKAKLNLTSGGLDSWKKGTDCCSSWIGITCHNHSNHVVMVDVSASGIGGVISDNLCHLRFLTHLDLMQNGLTGTLPPCLGNLSSLVSLNLSNNKLSGTLPTSFAHLSSLTYLYADGNAFNQTIPSSALPSSIEGLSLSLDHHQIISEAFFHNLTELKSLSLSNCILNTSKAWIPSFDLQSLRLTSCNMDSQIPLWIRTQHSLLELELADNKLVGEIPSWLWDISPSLQYINLTANHLQGHLPITSSLWMQAGMILDVSRNELTGEIPSVWPPRMKVILLCDNMLMGNIPHSLGTLNIQLLNLAKNNLTGSIPASIANCSSLQVLILAENNLTGSIPASIANYSSLQVLNLAKNNLTGSIPASIANYSSLQVLNLANNNLEGRVPCELGRLSRLQVLVLENNKLSGSFPSSITNCSELLFLDIAHNLFEGQIPRSIGNLSKLIVLVMRQNNFRDSIPSEIGQLKYLWILDLSSNHLSELIPHDSLSLQAMVIGAQGRCMRRQTWPVNLPFDITLNVIGIEYIYAFSTCLGYLDFSDNQLNGDVPDNIGMLQGLFFLNLSMNNLSGTIPGSLAKIGMLESLDLSTNRFSGNIPWKLQFLGFLSVLNLSNNNLSGSIPQQFQFLTFSETAFLGNPNLCGVPLPKSCPSSKYAYPPAFTRGRLSPPQCQSGKSCSHGKIVAGVIASVSVFMVLVLGLGFLWIRNWHRQRKILLEAILQKFELPIIPYEDLFDATDGFDESKLIGVGSFGSVYRGDLKDGRVVAVKVLNLDNEEAHKSFKEECKVLRNVRHRNLVRVLTACTNQYFKALVFEFISNGSLQAHLYPQGEDDNNDCQLGLKTRLDIAIDIAHAMEYLHVETFFQVIHCDLKPENVLLDEDMTAHVTDFGIARLTSGKQSVDSFASTLTIKGSVGYIAPEYGQGGRVSSKGDIYSYGILLLEMLTRKRPTDSMFAEDLTLHKWVDSAFPNSLIEVLDSTLFRGIVDMEIEMEEVDAVFKQCLIPLVGLGLACSKDSPKERPSMRDVARELKNIRNSLMENSGDFDRLKKSLSALLNSPCRAGTARTEGVFGSSDQSSSTY